MMLVASLACGLALVASPGMECAPTTSTLAVNTARTAVRDLSDLIRELRKADQPELRINVLEKIAAVPVSPEAPDAVVNALARGLDDDSFLVATKAVQLLGERIENDAALEHLVDACGDLEKVREKAFAAMKEAVGEIPKAGDDDIVAKLNRVTVLLDEKKVMLEALAAHETALLDAILKRRDDRCVEGLADLLEFQVFGVGTWRIAEGLFHIGTVPAIQEVIDLFGRTEKQVKERAKERKKLARQRPERVPKMWKGTKDAWKAREATRIEGLVARHDEVTEKMNLWRFELSSQVQALARKANLALPPSTADADAWEDWWRDRRGSLPKSLVD